MPRESFRIAPISGAVSVITGNAPVEINVETDESRAMASVARMDAAEFLRWGREHTQSVAAWFRSRVAHHMDREPFSKNEAAHVSFESIRTGLEALALELAIAGCEISPSDVAGVTFYGDSVRNIKKTFPSVHGASARISDKEVKQTKAYEGCPISRTWERGGTHTRVSFKDAAEKADILDDAPVVQTLPGDPSTDLSDVGSDELSKVLARGPGSVEPSNPDARMGSEEWNQVMREIRRDAEAKAMRKAVRVARNMARGEPARATDRQRRRENWELRHATNRAAWESGFRVGVASAS